MNIRLPRDVKRIIDGLKEAGCEAYAVGGCVRDAIMGRQPNDWDICTSALPEAVMEVFAGEDDMHIIPTGLQHGTVTIAIPKDDGHCTYEVTTFREDGEYKDSRRPESVRFVESVEADLSRRDFTINAMAYNEEVGLVDPFGGRSDIEKGIIRCVGDPAVRFNEDALRIMRAIRFAACLSGFEIREDTAEGMYEKLHLLDNIAVERIRTEFDKLLCGENAPEVLRKHRRVIARFIPEARAMFDLDQENPFHLYDVWEHTIHAVEVVDTGKHLPLEDLIKLKLAAFFHDIGKPPCKIVDQGWGHFYGHERTGSEMANDIMHRLRYDNETRKTVVLLIDKHGIVFNPAGKQAGRLLHKLGEDGLRMLIELERADVSAQHPDYVTERLENIAAFEEKVDELIEAGRCFSMRDLAIDGRDIMALGIEEGKKIGEIKKILLEKVIDGTLENDKDVLAGAIKEISINNN